MRSLIESVKPSQLIAAKIHSRRQTLWSAPCYSRRNVDITRSCLTRRVILTIPALIVSTCHPMPSFSFTSIPSGYRAYRDILDGYEFLVKSDWIPVTSAGNDVAFRSLAHPDQNLFVTVSSPSTSNYNSVDDIGKIEDIGQQVLRQYLTEFMSTRIGVVREGNFVSGDERIASDGKKYYDVEVVLRSYASRNQLAVTQAERQKRVELEWERRLFTVIGVANRRKYELRLQADINTKAADLETIYFMASTFRCTQV